MKRLGWMFLFLSVHGMSALATEEPGASDRQLAGELAKELKSALTQALQISPESAIAVCNERSPQIAAKISKAHDVQIGRTALRVRNTANRPAPWQEEVLKDFQRRVAAGEPMASMEYSATVEQDGIAEHRYMKAIPTEPLCIVCHGQQVAATLQQAILSKYPSDAATGFDVGDMRGAVYVVRR